MKLITCVESPGNWSVGDDILIIPNEINLLPQIAEEAILVHLPQVVGAVQKVRAQNPHRKMHGGAVLGGVIIGGAVVPLHIVQDSFQLVMDYVDVAPVGPVVPQLVYLQLPHAVVYHQARMELRWPWGGRRLR